MQWWGGAVCGHLFPNFALLLLVSKAAQTAHAVPLAGCWPVYLASRDAGRLKTWVPSRRNASTPGEQQAPPPSAFNDMELISVSISMSKEHRVPESGN